MMWFGRQLDRRTAIVVSISICVVILLSVWWICNVKIVEVVGHSMFPELHDGDLVCFVKGLPNPGQIVFAQVLGDSEMSIKFLAHDGGLLPANSHLISEASSPDEVEYVWGKKLFAIPWHIWDGEPASVDKLVWSPSGGKLACLRAGKLFLLEELFGLERFRKLSDEDFVLVQWADDATVIATGPYGKSSLISLDGEKSGVAHAALLSTSFIEDKPSWLDQIKEEECPDGFGHTWISKDVVWYAKSVPVDDRQNRWISYTHDLASGTHEKHLSGVSQIFPSGHLDRFVAVHRSGGSDRFVLHAEGEALFLGRNTCVLTWSSDGRKLAFVDQSGRIRIQKWR